MKPLYTIMQSEKRRHRIKTQKAAAVLVARCTTSKVEIVRAFNPLKKIVQNPFANAPRPMVA